MWTIRPIWLVLFMVWLWPATVGYAQVIEQPGIVLFTPEEAEKLRLLEEEWKIIDEILTRRQALSTLGPLIAMRSPTVQLTNPIAIIETATPINLSVHFIENGAPVKLETLEICGKAWGFRRCFTDQLKSYLDTNTNTLEAPNLDVPTGKYVIEIRIADEQGRETVANYKMVVAEAPKPSK